MRWLRRAALAAIALAATDASAKRVVIEPPVVRSCRTGKTWDDVTKCLAKLGTPELARSLPGARVVWLKKPPGSWIGGGFYLYRQRDGQWALSGMWESSGQSLLLGTVPLTIGRHTGYQLDIGQAFTAAMPVDAFVGRIADVRMRHAVFCPGNHWTCIDMVTACEVGFAGHVVWTFRGTVTIDGDFAKVAGDRRQAGPLCNVVERLYLGWSDS
jgi:hypothetical protein